MPNVTDGLEIIDNAIKEHGNSSTPVYALVSGGYDSTCAAAVAAHHKNFRGLLHMNTGTGVEATRDYVYSLRETFQCPLQEYCAREYKNAQGMPDPQVYEDMVKDHGFPGPSQHQIMYIRLKQRPLDQFVRENIDGRYILVSGARSEESENRKKNVVPYRRGEKRKDGRTANPNRIWVNVIHDWTIDDVLSFVSENDLPRNEVRDALCISAECLCGSHGDPSEIHIMQKFEATRYRAQWLLDLQRKVWKTHPWGWGCGGPPKYIKQQKYGQGFLFDLTPEEKQQDLGVMCIGCGKKERATGTQPKPLHIQRDLF